MDGVDDDVDSDAEFGIGRGKDAVAGESGCAEGDSGAGARGGDIGAMADSGGDAGPAEIDKGCMVEAKEEVG